MKNLILFLAVISMLWSCKVQKPDTIYITNTKIEKEYIRDTVVKLKVDSVYLEKQTKDTISELRTNLAYSKAFWSNGILYHSLNQSGSIVTKIQYKDKLKIDSVSYPVIQTKIVEKTNSKGWVAFVILSALVVIFFVWKILK